MYRDDTVESITVLGGFTKTGEEEPVNKLEIEKGEILVLVGPTGSGKSMLLADIELLAACDTPSRRTVLVNGEMRDGWRGGLIAQLSQTMNFVMDITVEDFLKLHASSRNIADTSVVDEVVRLANSLAGEPINPGDAVTTLSGGQSRALMIADIALISDSPIVLVDEIENAGIDKLKALEVLASQGKIIIVASHDPVIILMAKKRVVMQNGGMSGIRETTVEENDVLAKLIAFDTDMSAVKESLRTGGAIGRA